MVAILFNFKIVYQTHSGEQYQQFTKNTAAPRTSPGGPRY